MYKVVFSVACVLACTANLQAQDSVENLGYKIYTLGVQAARADGATKEALMKQISSLQQRRDRIILEGGPVDMSDDTIPVARPTGQGPATDWSRGSYGRGQQGCAECGGYMPQQWGRGPQYGSTRVFGPGAVVNGGVPFVRRGSYGYKVGTGIPGLPSFWTGVFPGGLRIW